jgi:hypothetical protein
MTVLEWILISILCVVYFMCLVTICVLTFKKGYLVLGIVGIFFPLLWFIGAILPPKRGSRYEIEEAMRLQQQLPRMTA